MGWLSRHLHTKYSFCYPPHLTKGLSTCTSNCSEKEASCGAGSGRRCSVWNGRSSNHATLLQLAAAVDRWKSRHLCARLRLWLGHLRSGPTVPTVVVIVLRFILWPGLTALKFGASVSAGVDIDMDALLSAHNNCALNGLQMDLFVAAEDGDESSDVFGNGNSFSSSYLI
jgi:hypothetical protein